MTEVRTAPPGAGLEVLAHRLSVFDMDTMPFLADMTPSYISAVMDLYRDVGIIKYPRGDLDSIVGGRLAQDEQMVETIKEMTGSVNRDWTETEKLLACTKVFKEYRVEAFARAYVAESMDRALDGKSLNKRQIDMFPVIKSEMAPRHIVPIPGGDTREEVRIKPFYKHVSAEIWAGMGRALQSNNIAALAKMQAVNKAVRLGMDHPINRANSLTIDIVLDIEAGRDYSSARLKHLARTMHYNVTEEVWQFGPTAKDNFEIVLEQLGNYYVHYKQHGDPVRVQKYRELFTTLDVDIDDKEIVFLIPDDPNTSGISDGRPMEQPVPPTAKATAEYDEASHTVKKASLSFELPSRKKVIAATVAAVAVAGGMTTAVMTGKDATPKNRTATFVVPNPYETPASESGIDSGDPASTPETTDHDTPASEMTQTEPTETTTPAPPVDAGSSHNPTASDHIKHHHGDPPAIPENIDISQLQSVTAPSHAQPQVVNTGPNQAAAQEATSYQVTYETLDIATTELEQSLLQGHEDIAADGNPEVLAWINEMTEVNDAKVSALHANGIIDNEAFANYREMAVSARALAEYSGLLGHMDTQQAHLDTSPEHAQFINAYIGKVLSKMDALQGLDTEHRQLIEQFLGSAAAFSIPQAQQTAWLQSQGIQTEPQQNEHNSESSNQNENSHTGNGNNGSGSSGSEQNNGPQEQAHQDTGNLSPEQSTALDQMQAMGTDWRNRAIVMRILIDGGVSPVAASGIVGGTCVEAAGCELDPTVEQIGGGPGRGIVQWEGGRLDNLIQYAADHDLDWKDIETQAKFILVELNGSEGAANSSLAHADTPQEAADIAVNQYERPADSDASRAKRAAYAEQTYYTYVMALKQAQIASSPNRNLPAPQIRDGELPTYDQVKAYYDKKYDGNANGLLTSDDLEVLGQQWGDARLYPAAAEAFRQMAAAFQQDMGKPLQLSGEVDAFRPFQVQIAAYTDPDKIDENSSGTSSDDQHMGAVPGTSNHGYGMAVDLASGINLGSGTPEYKWMIENGPKYGFIKPDWAKPGGSKQEDWHFDWTGGVKLPGQVVNQTQQQNQDHGHEDSSLQNFEGPISDAGYGLPVVIDQYVIGTKYEGYSDNRDGNVHTGLDILAKKGSPALAVRAGKVIGTGYDADGAGNYVKILLDNDHVVVYEHLESIGVSEDDQVQLGDMVGKVGNTGRVFSSTGDGTHLHLEINEVGYEGIASHSQTIAEVEAETLDPLDVLSTLDEVGQYADEHHLHRAVGELAIDATDGLLGLAANVADDAATLLDPAATQQPEPVQQPSATTEQTHGSNAEQPAHDGQGHYVQHTNGTTIRPQHSPFTHVQASDSEN